MSEMRELAWDIIRLGVRPALRKHHFKRPGGGSRFIREGKQMRQVVSCRASWSSSTQTGRLDLEAQQRIDHHVLWRLQSPPFPFDAVNGDERDTAVLVAHWLQKELIPALEQEHDLVALARAYEAGPYTGPEAAALWASLGFPEEAARSAAEHEPPF